jgi:hypothetical protein
VLIAGRHVESENSEGLTLHALVDEASSTLGKVVVSVPSYDGDEVTSWRNWVLVDTTLFREMEKSGGKAVGGEIGGSKVVVAKLISGCLKALYCAWLQGDRGNKMFDHTSS